MELNTEVLVVARENGLLERDSESLALLEVAVSGDIFTSIAKDIDFEDGGNLVWLVEWSGLVLWIWGAGMALSV